MPEYCRAYISGGTYFLTLVTYQRAELFSDTVNVSWLRWAIAQMRAELPCEIVAAVVLPEHVHFLWSLPQGDSNYSRRVGRLKVLFTQSLRALGMTRHLYPIVAGSPSAQGTKENRVVKTTTPPKKCCLNFTR
ncbi:MAG: transposase, partial [Thermosynechococcaceae cyanobacterium]